MDAAAQARKQPFVFESRLDTQSIKLDDMTLRDGEQASQQEQAPPTG